ncbi:MAG TPA: GNAT family N-acetyltransferase, partial [Pirellulales bacterium]|nr:GNAT family N-acetyltransferase [Pirellulales bacterium]
MAYRGRKLAAALLAQVQPGKAAVVLPPRAAAGQPPEDARELLAKVIAKLFGDGVQLVQALLESDYGSDAQLLADLGFRHLSNVLYLASWLPSFPTSEPNDGLEFVAHSLAERGRLADIVQRTYAGSLDFPQVEGLRQIDDILVGYASIGVFDPARWLIASHRGVDVGCLLLADHPRTNHWELIYMGVVPEARGRGWGLCMTRHAQWLARR